MAVTDYFMHCMPGWRAIFCVLDNLAPHRDVPGTGDPEEGISNARDGRFGWVWKLHDWIGTVGAYGRGE